jgi:hypothetical protein
MNPILQNLHTAILAAIQTQDLKSPLAILIVVTYWDTKQ